MKAIKRIMVWVLISLITQIAVLYYVDNYLFAAESADSIVAKKVVNDKNKEKELKDISIPEDAEHISVSYDGGYVSYYKDDVLKVIDMYTGEENTVEFEDDHKVSFYKWAPDRDIILLAIKEDNYSNDKYKFYSYDAERNKKDLLQTKDGVVTSIKTESNSNIEDIELTPLTNMIYVKVSLEDGRCKIYNINVMMKIEKVRTEPYFIGDIKIIPNDDRIAYESGDNGEVYITGTQTPIDVNEIENLCLISVDQNDRIYVGETDEKKVNNEVQVKTIYYGTAEQDSSEWEKVTLKNPVNKSDIFVTKEGKIYINDNLKGSITELSTNKETVYKGKILEMYEDGVASISDGKLKEEPLE